MSYIRKKKGSFFSSPIVLIIFVVILIIVARGVFTLGGKYKFSKEKHDNLVNELEELENKKARLENDIEMLGTERGQEEEIREKFRVVKDGEEMIIIIDDEELVEN